MDILHNAMKMDLGPMNAVVEYSFLNFSVWVFLFCVLLMVGISRMSTSPDAQRKPATGLEVGHFTKGSVADVAFTAIVATCVIGLWYHFR